VSGNKDRDKRLAKKREQKRLKRLRSAGSSHRSSASAGGIAPRPPTKFTIIAGPLLEHVGPLVVAEWSVPKSLADQLVAEGKPVPPPVVGHVLVDTGARKTGIAQHTAEMLSLTSIGTASSFGAHGPQESVRYCADFTLRIIDLPTGKALAVTFEDHEVLGIPKMKESFDQFGLRDPSGNLLNVIGILGREFLRHTKLTYNGPAGTVEFEIDTKSVETAKLNGVIAPALVVK
jgi:hypothetical protein